MSAIEYKSVSKSYAGVKALDSGVAAVRIGDARVLFDAAAGTMLTRTVVEAA